MRPGLLLDYQRAAALLLLVTLAIIIATFLVRPFISMYLERNTTIEFMEKQLMSYQVAAHEYAALTQQLEQLQRDPAIASYHLQNAVPALAAAELQQHVQKTVERLGGRLVSMQAIDAGHLSSQGMVQVRIRLRCDVDSLRNILFDLESGRPLIRLDNVHMRAINPVRGAGNASSEILDVGFDASGYLPGWLS